jgi:predicted nucleotidyltransferase
MNIHFDNKEVFEELKKLTIFKTKIGSWIYGTNDEFSDVDILYIYVPSYDEVNSIGSNHHQYQYKEDGIDHIFVDIYNFIRNTLNGDSTINIEVINNPNLIGTDLTFLYNMRLSFSNHKIIRSYLGMARRDLKHISNGKSNKDKNKKLNHVLRGYTFCKLILNNEFRPFIEKDSELYKEMESNKLITCSRQRHEIASELSEKVSILREEVNTKLDSNTLGFPQYMNINDMYSLDEHLSKWTKIWRKRLGDSNYYNEIKYYIYDAMEHEIRYEIK